MKGKFARLIRTIFGGRSAVHRDQDNMTVSSGSKHRLDTMELHRQEVEQREAEREKKKELYKMKVTLQAKSETGTLPKKKKKKPKQGTAQKNHLMNETNGRPVGGVKGSWPKMGKAVQLVNPGNVTGTLNGSMKKLDSMVRSLLQANTAEFLETEAAAFANSKKAKKRAKKKKKKGKKKKKNDTLRDDGKSKQKNGTLREALQKKKKENGTLQEDMVDPSHDKKLPWWTNQVEQFFKKHDPSRESDAKELVIEHESNLPRLMYRLHREYRVPQDHFFVRGARGLSIREDDITSGSVFSLGSVSV